MSDVLKRKYRPIDGLRGKIAMQAITDAGRALRDPSYKSVIEFPDEECANYYARMLSSTLNDIAQSVARVCVAEPRFEEKK